MRTNALFAWSLTLIVLVSVYGQEPADHPLVGRFAGATIQHQEVSRFGAYEIPVGPDETARTEGEVWMTLYRAPDDSSTFSIYSTYRTFLEGEGFELLLAYPPGEAPPQFLRRNYELAPFADHGNYNHSAPITNGNERVSSYIAARRERPEGTIWVSVAMNEGWSDVPQYKLDVVVEGANSGGIVSTGSGAAVTQTDTAGNDDGSSSMDDSSSGSAAAPDGTYGTDVVSAVTTGLSDGSLRIRAGLQGYLLLDPALAGSLSVTTDLNGEETGADGRGIRNVWGPFVEAVWFITPQLGVSLHATRLASLVDFYANNTQYNSEFEIMNVRFGVHTRISTPDRRAHLMAGLGVGVAGTTVRYKSEGSSYTECSGNDPLSVVAASLETTIPLPGIFGVTAGCDYLFIPFERFTVSNTENEASVTYVEGNFGGLTLQIGLTAAFE